MNVRLCYVKRLLLSALLLWIALACFAQQEMRISHVGRYSISNPNSHTVYAMQGDTLAMYDYAISGRVINIFYESLAPGAMQPMHSIFTYEVPAEWGYIGVLPLCFEYKGGKLYSAYDTGAKLLVFFSTPQITDVHIFDKTGIQYVEEVHILNESSGYIYAAQYPNYQTWVCSMDFENHSLPLFYQYQGGGSPDYCHFFSVFDEYLLAFTSSDEFPDILVHDGAIVQIIPGNWGGYSPFAYTRTQELCGNHFYTEEQSMVYTTDTYIGWIENGILYNALFSMGFEESEPNRLFYCEPQSDSTFTCVFSDGQSYLSYFRNYLISDHALFEYDFFPNLTGYQYPIGQFRMGDDYLVALAAETENNYNLILADYTEQSIRNYEFTTSDAMYSKFFHSDSLFYWLGQNGKVHIFRLEFGSDADDDLLTPVSATITAYPNPFRSSCSVKVESTRQANASLGVYNLRGQLVKSLHQGSLTKGDNIYSWDGKDASGQTVSPGVYLLHLKTGENMQTTKIVYIK